MVSRRRHHHARRRPASPPLGALSDQADIANAFNILHIPRRHLHRTALFPATRASHLCIDLYIIACICFEMGIVFYNAFLPDIAPPKRIGRISGQAWGVGYFGGLLSMAVLMVGLYPQKPRGLAHQRNPRTHPGDKHRRCDLVCHLQPPGTILFTRTPCATNGDKLSLAASYRRILQTLPRTPALPGNLQTPARAPRL